MMFNEQFWTAVAFFILIACVYKPLKSTLSRALDNRAAQIKKELDEALLLKEEAETLLVSYQRKQKEAHEEARNIIRHAEEEVHRMTEEMHKELQAVLLKRMQLAKDKMAAYEKKVLEEVYNRAVDIAVDAVHSVLAKNKDASEAQHLIQQSIHSLKQQLKP